MSLNVRPWTVAGFTCRMALGRCGRSVQSWCYRSLHSEAPQYLHGRLLRSSLPYITSRQRLRPVRRRLLIVPRYRRTVAHSSDERFQTLNPHCLELASSPT